MRIMCFLLMVFGVTLVFSIPAEAARFTGAYLLQVCEKDEKGRESAPGAHAACQSYISGVLDTTMSCRP